MGNGVAFHEALRTEGIENILQLLSFFLLRCRVRETLAQNVKVKNNFVILIQDSMESKLRILQQGYDFREDMRSGWSDLQS